MWQRELFARNEPAARFGTRSMAVRADSVREADHSVAATVVAGERTVRVFDWENFRAIDEVLRIAPAELVDGVPLLDSHQRDSVDSVLGHAAEWRKEAGDIISARAFFDMADERGARAYAKVKDKHLRAVSVGYLVTEAVDIPPGEHAMVDGQEWTAGPRWLRISTGWKTRELSLVPVGADDGAKFRGATTPPAIDYRLAALLTDRVHQLGERGLTRGDLLRDLTAATTLVPAHLNLILAGRAVCPAEHLRTIVGVLDAEGLLERLAN